jgi:peptidase A4-like protein
MREESSMAGASRGLSRLAVLLTLVTAAGAFAAAGALARGGGRAHRHHHARHHHKRRPAKRNYPKTSPTHRTSAHGRFVQPSAHANQSNNWSGYNQGSLEQGGKLFSSISANWTVPTASQHASGQAEYSSDWIGIGGGCLDAGCTATDSTLIQTGTEQDVSSNGTPSYSAWWEIIPGPSLTITSINPSAGDAMSASITETLPGVWTIKISDSTKGQSYTTTVPYSSTKATAEWIQETPLILGTNAGFAALPNLTSAAFDQATTNGAPANLKTSEEMNLVDSKSNVIGAPSAPDPDADGFNTCTWAGTCTAPSSS